MPPCRCCGSIGSPSKGLKKPVEKEINEHLKKAAELIRKEAAPFEDDKEWFEGWCEAFDHHLGGCPEGNNCDLPPTCK